MKKNVHGEMTGILYPGHTWTYTRMHGNVYTWKYDRKHIHLHIKCVTHCSRGHTCTYKYECTYELRCKLKYKDTYTCTYEHILSFSPSPSSHLLSPQYPQSHFLFRKGKGFLGISTKHGISNYTSRRKRVPKQAKESQTSPATPAMTPTRRPS